MSVLNCYVLPSLNKVATAASTTTIYFINCTLSSDRYFDVTLSLLMPLFILFAREQFVQKMDYWLDTNYNFGIVALKEIN